MRWSNLSRDLPPRGSRPDPRPAHAVHDLRAADPALSDPGDRHRPVRRGARAEAPAWWSWSAPSTCRRAPPLLNAERRRLQSRALRFARRGRACWSCSAEPADGPWGKPETPRAGDPRAGWPRRSWSIPRDLPAAAPRRERRRDPDPVQQRRRAEPDHLSAAQGGARSLEARASSTAG